MNGQLNLFEYPETLDVMPMRKMQTDDTMLFFPFIFGQSLVKPIVHRVQTQAFFRFEAILKETNLLVILGFNLNEDDNHINAFIHDYINNGGRVIIVTDDESPKAHLKLKCREDQIDYCQVKYGNNEKVIDEVFLKINSLKLSMRG